MSSSTTTSPGSEQDQGPQNMVIVKPIAMNMVRNPTDKHSLKVRRKRANLDPDYLETLVTQRNALI